MLRVRDWDTLYETHETRKLKRLGWVAVPNRHDGDGYCQLVDHPDGAAHLGCWLAVLQVASKCTPRGVLVHDGGSPHTPESLARKTRLPAKLMRDAIMRLLEIGWLDGDVPAPVPGDSPALTGDSTDVPGDRPGRIEQNRTERTEKDICASPLKSASDARVSDDPFSLSGNQKSKTDLTEEWFSAFWKAYWLRRARKPARIAFGKACKSQERFAEIMAAVTTQTPEMLSREPAKRPHAATWLNAERWTDELIQPAAASAIDRTLDLIYSREEK